MKSKLLVVTTFYNEHERLKFTLDNMLCQDSNDFVHLIIDDGSRNDMADSVVENYIKRSKCRVCYEKHPNTGINRVHMDAFARTEEFECTHFMWLDCGDGLKKNAIKKISSIINKCASTWLHLDGYYVSDNNNKKVRMSSKSYLPYLKKEDQFLPFCFSISTYGHFVIPYRTYCHINPKFELTDGFYYDAQIIGALSLNRCPHYFVKEPLSIIQDDLHFSVSNSLEKSYRDNLVSLSKFVVSEQHARERIVNISEGIDMISVRKLISGKSICSNKKNFLKLKEFYMANGIKMRDRYKKGVLFILSILYGGW